MSHFEIIIEEELPQRCESCGIIDECRPYGLNHEEICHDCGLKDPALTEIRMKQFYAGCVNG
jgi:hypothetical protein